MGGYLTNTEQEKAILIGIVDNSSTEHEVIDYLKELAFLTETAGALPVKQFIQKLDVPNPRTFIGAGKLEEIRHYIKANDIDIIVKDDLWEDLIKKYPTIGEKIIVGNIEICKNRSDFDDIEKVINQADIYDGIRYIRLEDVYQWKKKSGREKDQEDIKLIEEYWKTKP